MRKPKITITMKNLQSQNLGIMFEIAFKGKTKDERWDSRDLNWICEEIHEFFGNEQEIELLK